MTLSMVFILMVIGKRRMCQGWLCVIIKTFSPYVHLSEGMASRDEKTTNLR